jgi:hypothetical protein
MMDNHKYFLRQANNLQKLARSIEDPAKAQEFFLMAADFRNRAKQLAGDGEPMSLPMTDGGSSTGEMDVE